MQENAKLRFTYVIPNLTTRSRQTSPRAGVWCGELRKIKHARRLREEFVNVNHLLWADE